MKNKLSLLLMASSLQWFHNRNLVTKSLLMSHEIFPVCPILCGHLGGNFVQVKVFLSGRPWAQRRVCAQLFSLVHLFATPGVVDHQVVDLCPWGFSGNNMEVGCHFLLQRIFLTQGLNQHLLRWQEIVNINCRQKGS